MNATSSPTTHRTWLAIGIALVLPTFITWLYFFQAAGTKSSLLLGIFAVVKVLQFAFPAMWVWLVQKEPVNIKTLQLNRLAGVGIGLAFGAMIATAMFALYFGVLKNSSAIDFAVKPISDKVAGFGVDSPLKYLALGLFYSLVHSLLEEYYWRWFVFGQLRKVVPLTPAIAISALGFMAHHVLVLGAYFGFASWQTIAASASVAIGGAVWAWLYDRRQSLVATWLSHLLVDAAIFGIGYDLVRHLWA